LYTEGGGRSDGPQDGGEPIHAALLSAVVPFLPAILFFVGLALLIEGLVPIALPVCLIGYSTDGIPIVARCVSAFNVSLLITGSVIVTASVAWMLRVYLRRGARKR
jgi:hypothetical protein